MGNYKDEHGKTRIGVFLNSLGKVSTPLLNIASDVTGIEGFKALSNVISKSKELTEEEKVQALAMIEQDIQDEKEKTKRWVSDMESDSFLSKNVRPMVLIYIVLFATIIIILDSSIVKFEVKESWIRLIDTLLFTVVGGYFALREVGKYFVTTTNKK